MIIVGITLFHTYDESTGMNIRLGLICATAVVMLTGVSQAAAPTCTSASIIAGYKAGVTDPTVAPQGTFVVNRNPVAAEEFQVVVDAIEDKGPGIGGGIKVWAGLTTYDQAVAHNGAAIIAYGPPAAITIKDPPATLMIRGRIQYRANANGQWVTLTTVFSPYKSGVVD
jgi:hypothetical protein